MKRAARPERLGRLSVEGRHVAPPSYMYSMCIGKLDGWKGNALAWNVWKLMTTTFYLRTLPGIYAQLPFRIEVHIARGLHDREPQEFVDMRAEGTAQEKAPDASDNLHDYSGSGIRTLPESVRLTYLGCS